LWRSLAKGMAALLPLLKEIWRERKRFTGVVVHTGCGSGDPGSWQREGWTRTPNPRPLHHPTGQPCAEPGLPRPLDLDLGRLHGRFRRRRLDASPSLWTFEQARSELGTKQAVAVEGIRSADWNRGERKAGRPIIGNQGTQFRARPNFASCYYEPIPCP
jgi:hypothetical protein